MTHGQHARFDILTGPTIHIDAERARWVLESLKCKNVDQCLAEFQANGVTKFFTDAHRWRGGPPSDPIEIRDKARFGPGTTLYCEHGKQSGFFCGHCSVTEFGTEVPAYKPK